MNPLTSPMWMTWLNAVATIYGALEGTGIFNMLGSKAGTAIAIGGVINTIAHAFSPPTPGPMTSTKP